MTAKTKTIVNDECRTPGCTQRPDPRAVGFCISCRLAQYERLAHSQLDVVMCPGGLPVPHYGICPHGSCYAEYKLTRRERVFGGCDKMRNAETNMTLILLRMK